MKTLTYVIILFGLISIVPAHAARTTRPPIVVIVAPPTPISPL